MGLRRWWNTLRLLFHRRSVERDLEDEFSTHLEMQTAENVRRGMAPDEARAAAQRLFGQTEAIKEEFRDHLAHRWVDEAFKDLNFSVRSLRGRPGFCALAISSLAIGIGVNTAIFSVVDRVLLRPLPVPGANQLVRLEEQKFGDSNNSNPQRLADWQALRSFSHVTGTYGEGLVLTGLGEPARVDTLRTVGDYLGTLRITPALGRGFHLAEQRGQGAPVIVLSHHLWASRFDANPNVLGRSIELGSTAYTVIGVLPGFLSEFEALAPAPAELQRGSRKAGYLDLIARLQDGVTRESAEAELRTVVPRLAAQYPESDAGLSVRVEPLQSALAKDSRQPLLLLQTAAALLLLLACVNLSGLLVSRGLSRRREVAIRVALGASRWRLIRMFLTDSLLIAVAGGATGVLTAVWGIEVLKVVLPASTPQLASAALDRRVLLFAVLVSLGCALLFGLLPAWNISFSAASSALRDGFALGARVRRNALRSALVSGQVALCLVLLVVASLLARSFFELRSQPLGFHPDHTLVLQINFPWDTPSARLQSFYRQAVAGFESIPGVRAAGLLDRTPFEGRTQTREVGIRGKELPPALRTRNVDYRAFAGDPFDALGIPLRAGRLPLRGRKNLREVVVNETFATTFLSDRDPLSTAITFDTAPAAGDPPPRWYQIVGIVGDVRQSPGIPSDVEVFLPIADTYWPLAHFVLRGEGDPRALASAARAVVRRLDPQQTIDRIDPLETRLALTTRDQKINAFALSAVAGMALLLAAIGIYGVIASDVAARTQEIGVRIALGAAPKGVLTMILGRALILAALGMPLGVAAALFAARFLAGMLYGVTATDLFSLLTALGLLFVVAALAGIRPALRAATIDPLQAIRHE